MTNINSQEVFYRQLLLFYDIVDDMLTAIEADGITNSAEQMAIAEPVIKQVNLSAEILINTYLNFVEGNKSASNKDKRIIEREIRNMVDTMVTFSIGAKKLAA